MRGGTAQEKTVQAIEALMRRKWGGGGGGGGGGGRDGGGREGATSID